MRYVFRSSSAQGQRDPFTKGLLLVSKIKKWPFIFPTFCIFMSIILTKITYKEGKYFSDELVKGSCQSPSGCMDECIIFNALCTAFTGCFFAMECGWSRTKTVLKFLVPPRPFWDSVLTVVSDSIVNSIFGTAFPFVIFTFFYCILGGEIIINQPISLLLGWNLHQVPLSSLIFSDYCSFLLSSFLLCCFLMSGIGISVGLISLFFVQRHKFPLLVDPALPPAEMTLSNAMTSSSSYVRFLAFYDLKVLVDERGQRMFDLLKLSHPGRHPVAWNSILNPITHLVLEMKLKFQGFIKKVEMIDHENQVKEENKTGTKKPNPKILFSTLTPLDDMQKHGCEDGINLRFRDMVSPIEAKVVFKREDKASLFQDPKNMKSFIDSKKSPAKKLAEAPSKLLKAAVQKGRIMVTESYSKVLKWIKKPGVAKEFKDLLVDSQLVFCATEILTGVCEFSITNDKNGVIATTVGKIITLHVEFYEAVEELVMALELLSPLKFVEVKRCRKGLMDLLDAYKRALVFFLIQYGPSVEVFQIQDSTIKQWNRICYGERSDERIASSSREEKGQSLFPEAD